MEIIKQTASFLVSSHALAPTSTCTSCGCSYLSVTSGSTLCFKCTATYTDITEGITRQAILHHCYLCKCYRGSSSWIPAESESKELLSVCLKKIKGLNKVKLIDACFIWTEPTSRRLKVKLTVEKEIVKNFSLKQSLQVEYMVYHQQCQGCKKKYPADEWNSLVQLHDRNNNRKTILLLEQLILKYNMHDKALRIKESQGGIDFFYDSKNNAHRLVEFLQNMFCVKVKHFKHATYQNAVKNQANYKYVYSLDLPKVFKDDLIVITPKVAEALGNCSRILVCVKVSSNIEFVDPSNMNIIEMTCSQYFQFENEMTIVSPRGNLSEFLVLRTEDIVEAEEGKSSIKNRIIRALVSKTSDQQQFDIKTYLGDILNEGNYALGYDFTSINFNGILDDLSVLDNLPDVVLLRKVYKDMITSERIWRLKHFEDKNSNKNDQDYNEFLNDLETNPELRAHINLYRNEKVLETQRLDASGKKQSGTSSKQKKQGKKLRILGTAKTNVKVASSGDEQDGEDDDKKGDIQVERRVKKQEKKAKEEEEDPIVKLEELLADMSLEDSETEDNDEDVIDEFIRRLEKVKIEGKE